MLPAHIAQNVKQQVLYYLQSTFDFRDDLVEEAFLEFLEDPGMGIFKGPWTILQRPYRRADEGYRNPMAISPPFHPFMHQDRAWRNLASRGQKPQSTIITTGTGSGKTECFLFPILDHCLRLKQEGQRGIKAIILYPMNALAADQGKRFAKTVYDFEELRNAGIRVGNYTGRYEAGTAGDASGTKRMSREECITNHQAQQDDPPDILLTNYKMLDFLLMRPSDKNLWRYNEPGVLQYLVLDELHTYDGAQGSDVACLIRRLKERLDCGKGNLCVVGTSATLDSSRDTEGANVDAQYSSKDRLADFAKLLFEEEIPVENIIEEDRLSVSEIIDYKQEDPEIPDPLACRPSGEEDAESYARRQARLWKVTEPKDEDETWELALGNWLKRNSLFAYLLKAFENAEKKGDGPLPWHQLVQQVSKQNYQLKKLNEAEQNLVLQSFFALIAQAKDKHSGRAFPLVPTQVQLWVRELRRLGRVVDELPIFSWLDEPPARSHCLPAFHCSECGESGWVSMITRSNEAAIQARGVMGYQLCDDPRKIYDAWFGVGETEQNKYSRKKYHNEKIVIISPYKWADRDYDPVQGELGFNKPYLCPHSLVLRQGNGPCPLTNTANQFRVRVNIEKKTLEDGKVMGDQGCPRCGSKEGVFFIGSQAATMSSVAIDEMFGSVLNNDPKLLAFTDSVQDASHRAGFFSARTYQFTYRTALQHLLDDAGKEGVPLKDIGRKLLDYWSEKKPGRPGSLKEAMACLMPTDIQDYSPWLLFRDDEKQTTPDKKLLDEVVNRLTWQATSEFGLMQTHGRTLESGGCSCLGWNEEIIEATVNKLKDSLHGLDPATAKKIDDKALTNWLYGMLYRFRQRGSLYHPYIKDFARKNYWGKYPFGKTVEGRETYPPAHRYQPHLLVDYADRNHENLAAPTRSSKSPWHVVWARRTLGKNIAESTILDFNRILLRVGESTGLLKRLAGQNNKEVYAISDAAAVIYADGINLKCDKSKKSIFRPDTEGLIMQNGPSLDYYARQGVYHLAEFNQRQEYYQRRYRKGSLRRIVAQEHTGLLETEEREKLEKDFARNKHFDDPNVITCTSTLEMGIDIGDLSSTMLCSVPPNTANYLQRIGRAGRSTGTSLIISIINQKPHDLFFFARPNELLRGEVQPPGCWLDASAVLERQYLGYCIDTATKRDVITEFPKVATKLAEDLENPKGSIMTMLAWMSQNEEELKQSFLSRFSETVYADTIERFRANTTTDLLTNRIQAAALEHSLEVKNLRRGIEDLLERIKELDEGDDENRSRLNRELKIVKGRLSGTYRTQSFQILSDAGLLPNYAFPERGVRFYGSVYNKHGNKEDEIPPVELSRPGATAIRELAPHNLFYTHKRQFRIQQIGVGDAQNPIVEKLAICGSCGHLRKATDVNAEGAAACPQCGNIGSQLDVGQHHDFIEFSKSQSISYMEHYDSKSGDLSDERQRTVYNTINCFDQTVEGASGATVYESLPFGIEYRGAMVLRTVNAGFHDQLEDVEFGDDAKASADGFLVCADCGVAKPRGRKEKSPEDIHRGNCKKLKQYKRAKQEGKGDISFNWKKLYLYRKLQSEAIRLLMHTDNDRDIETLKACIQLGLKIKFHGNPAHLIIDKQVLPDLELDIKRNYLVLMDAVPGGSGYLKSLYQEKNKHGIEGEGIMDVLRHALDALENCKCRTMVQRDDRHDPDGCYRCIRSYQSQYSSEDISRELGIELLKKLIKAGKKRKVTDNLDKAGGKSLFGSSLERQFVEKLEKYVEDIAGSSWREAIIKGSRGYLFRIDDKREWTLELQPKLGPAQGVGITSQPDFLLSCNDEQTKPVAIFTDGFEYHCHPNNRLRDDLEKRRAILESQRYWVWNLTWDDVEEKDKVDEFLFVNKRLKEPLQKHLLGHFRDEFTLSFTGALSGSFRQLKAYIAQPLPENWRLLAYFSLFLPMSAFDGKSQIDIKDFTDFVHSWSTGTPAENPFSEEGTLIVNPAALERENFISYGKQDDIIFSKAREKVSLLARLRDEDSYVEDVGFSKEWGEFLRAMNLYQFIDNFQFTTSSEAKVVGPPVVDLPKTDVSQWDEIKQEVLGSIKPLVDKISFADIPLPEVEHYLEGVSVETVAELAWPEDTKKIAVLAGDQVNLAASWEEKGWKVFAAEALASGQIEDLVAALGQED